MSENDIRLVCGDSIKSQVLPTPCVALGRTLYSIGARSGNTLDKVVEIKNTRIGLVVSEEEKSRITEAARAEKRSISSFMRAVSLEKAAPILPLHPQPEPPKAA